MRVSFFLNWEKELSVSRCFFGSLLRSRLEKTTGLLRSSLGGREKNAGARASETKTKARLNEEQLRDFSKKRKKSELARAISTNDARRSERKERLEASFFFSSSHPPAVSCSLLGSDHPPVAALEPRLEPSRGATSPRGSSRKRKRERGEWERSELLASIIRCGNSRTSSPMAAAATPHARPRSRLSLESSLRLWRSPGTVSGPLRPPTWRFPRALSSTKHQRRRKKRRRLCRFQRLPFRRRRRPRRRLPLLFTAPKAAPALPR